MKYSFLLLSLLFMNCSSSVHTTGQDNNRPEATLEGTYWKLYELNGKSVTTSKSNQKELHFILQASDSTIRGNGGCNGFGGKYELKKNERIRFSKIISTLMACEHLATENEFFKTLERVDNFYLKGDTLTLNKARMAPLARFVAVH